MYLKRGKEKEAEFSKLFTNTKFSNRKADILDHWDVSVSYKIDVKGLRKRHRHDENTDETTHWIEIKNVHGNRGWLYGEADLFAFELNKYWVIVDKLKLQDYIAKNTVKEYRDSPTINHLYRRKDRKDIITLVNTVDLIYISNEFIKK